MEAESQTYRLPRTVWPEKYEICLTPDLKNFTFDGNETVHVVVEKPTDEIQLNAAELKIDKVVFEGADGAAHEAKISYDETAERAIFKFAKQIPAGKGKLAVKFSGILNDKLHGFYRSTYKNDAGEEKTLATTQFESTDARRAFPCWDEPEHKAVFGVTLIVDEKLTAISNAAVVSEKPSKISGKKEVVFADSIKMSTYLVAFIVGEFVGTEPVFAGSTPIRIWAVPGKERLTKFAQDIAVFSTNFFADYYGIAYPGDKMDLIAIPDFASGAMENLGAITFRETALLVEEKTASHAELERIADVVAHEIAHMWFGDLVTMKWWNGLWLNEAFATFAEMLAVDKWKPNWKRWDSFGVSRATASTVDGLKSTRPIEFPVISPDDAGAMFDVLTYEKGASVLRMLEQYLGADVFRKGVSLYLKKHEYANAETTDLWDGIEEASKEPVRQMMDTWIFNPGYPLISVTPSGNGITLTQQRFFYLAEGADTKQLFHVPIMYKAKTDKGTITKKFIMDKDKMSIELPGKVEWVVVNEGGHGFYRVAYAPELLVKLTENLKELSAIERFNLVNDTWASVLAGHTKAADYLKMIKLFVEEEDKNVWAIIIASLSHMARVIDASERPKLQAFVVKQLTAIMNKLGWSAKPTDNELSGQLRGMVINALGTVGNDKEIQAEAAKVYDKYIKDRTSVDANVAQAVVYVLAYAGDQKRYDQFTEEFKKAATPQDEVRFLFALADFQNPDLAKETMEMTVNGEVRTQNAPYLMQRILGNVVARQEAWEFFQKNWDKFIEQYPQNTIPRMSEGVTYLVDPVIEKQVIEFFKNHKVKQGGKTIDQHLEKLHVAVLFKQREASNIASAIS
jgi:puromycin-sensitive aminopeptidase